ncbi:MAG: ribosomal protein [Candidatus Angelobacter sp.]|nr:ribosomal protein [Candidatus Angelobacter sp.]
MIVEFTGRQYEVTPAVRKQVEHGLEKLQKILGKTFDTHVILATEKKRNIAEITITIRNNSFVGMAEAAEMSQAVGEAIDKVDRQAVKYKTKFRARKRSARKASASAAWNGQADGQAPTEQKMAVGISESTAVDVVIHSFPMTSRVTEAHVVRSDEAVALRPMTVEEAVKEAEFRDREVFVFRDTQGKVKVLHRKRNGKMELIEAP